MYRLSVIVRHTFLEAILQPIYALLIGLGAAILVIFGLLPFFTLGEDTVMFKAVGLDVILLLALVSTLFATSKSIFEEIEDRTMLTLMSKPVRRWEVLVGKYVGIILSSLLSVTVMGTVLCLATYWRIPGDYQIKAASIDARELKQLLDYRLMHIGGLVPSLFLLWLQICVLAAIGVALSTRFSLVVNMPVVILLYIAGNLTRFLFPLTDPASPLHDSSVIAQGFAYTLSLILPYLQTFDLRPLTVYKPLGLAGTQFAADPLSVSPWTIWKYVGVATLYGAAYSAFALSAGMWLFQTRELGGAEG